MYGMHHLDLAVRSSSIMGMVTVKDVLAQSHIMTKAKSQIPCVSVNIGYSSPSLSSLKVEVYLGRLLEPASSIAWRFLEASKKRKINVFKDKNGIVLTFLRAITLILTLILRLIHICLWLSYVKDKYTHSREKESINTHPPHAPLHLLDHSP